MLRALHRDGWHEVHQEGSHLYLAHPTKPGYVTLAMHTGKIIDLRTLGSILRQAGLTVDEFIALL